MYISVAFWLFRSGIRVYVYIANIRAQNFCSDDNKTILSLDLQHENSLNGWPTLFCLLSNRHEWKCGFFVIYSLLSQINNFYWAYSKACNVILVEEKIKHSRWKAMWLGELDNFWIFSSITSLMLARISLSSSFSGVLFWQKFSIDKSIFLSQDFSKRTRSQFMSPSIINRKSC